MTSSPCQQCQYSEDILEVTRQDSVCDLRSTIHNLLNKIPSIIDFYGFDVSMAEEGDQNKPLRVEPYGNEDKAIIHLVSTHPMAKKALLTGGLEYQAGDLCTYTFIGVKYPNASQGIWVIKSSTILQPVVLRHLYYLLQAHNNCSQHLTKTNTDPLTGLQNRQSLSKRLDHLLHKKRRETDPATDQAACICMFDIDFFKRVNDDFGHLYGDEVLLLFSGLMKKTFRESDSLFRYGGEEFIVLLNHCTPDLALNVLERFRKAVENYDFPQVGHITVSCGFVPMQVGVPANILVDRADNALYYAKEHGRNRVENYNFLLEQGLVVTQVLNMETELF